MTLQDIVAKLADCPPSDVTPSFSLDRPGLQGSMRRSILIASIRKNLGVDCLEAARALTFGELECFVTGGTALREEARPSAPVIALSEDLKKSALQSLLRCGIDIESADALPDTEDFAGHEFYQASFTPDEIAYCARQSRPRLHFAARWCAKESLKKCDPAFLGERMSSIEVVRSESGRLSLRHHGGSETEDLSHAVSVAHTDTLAVAVVIGPPASWLLKRWVLAGLAAATVAAVVLIFILSRM